MTLLHKLFLAVSICLCNLSAYSKDGESEIRIGNVGYLNNEVAYIDCGVSTILIRAGVRGAYGLVAEDWNVSSNFSYQYHPDKSEISVTLDPTRADGHVTADLWGNQVTVYIKQKPTPTLTIEPTLCSTGESKDYSVTLNFYGPHSANVVWETTGGITVNGGSSYRVNNNTISRAKIQHNSYGTLTVYGEIAGCNIRTYPVVKHIGTPSTNQLIFDSSPTFWGSICTGQYYYLQLANPLPIDQYSFTWTKLEGGENFMYSPSGKICGLTGISSNAPSYGIIELTVTNMACGTTGTVNRDFYIENCSGSFMVMSNPVSDKITAEFEPVSDENYLPKSLRLSHERNGVVREINLHEKYSKEAAKNGLRIDIDVKDLPKDTYYLQGVYRDGKMQSKRIVVN